MFTCIACTKQTADEREEDDEGVRESGTPSTKEAVKGLTAQVHKPHSLSLSLLELQFLLLVLELLFRKTNNTRTPLPLGP